MTVSSISSRMPPERISSTSASDVRADRGMPDPTSSDARLRLAKRFQAVRAQSEALCAPLGPEDMVAQSMPDASPAKWHLAHTTWFFETFVLAAHGSHHRPHHPQYGHLFNSYYNGAGDRHPRPQRGLLTRPDTHEVLAYRSAIDEQICRLIEVGTGDVSEAQRVIEIGLHHEQQHQELLLTDIKHLFAQSPLEVCYRGDLATSATSGDLSAPGWMQRPEGLYEIGHEGESFAFDNERPRHRVFLEDHAIADRLVTNHEYQAFIDDGGYQRPELWLDRGWGTVNEGDWRRPFYWRDDAGDALEFTLAGLRPRVANEPVSHVSFFEADAFARWAGARLPREDEWEVLASDFQCEGNFVESGRLHPQAAASDDPQLFGDLWEWTSSPYGPYPGFETEAGTLGEYNGKFMSSQMTLRGGSCASASAHVRATYRNFFHPPDRWQFSGIRLAKEF